MECLIKDAFEKFFHFYISNNCKHALDQSENQFFDKSLLEMIMNFRLICHYFLEISDRLIEVLIDIKLLNKKQILTRTVINNLDNKFDFQLSVTISNLSPQTSIDVGIELSKIYLSKKQFKSSYLDNIDDKDDKELSESNYQVKKCH
jgi:hypothetical protein